MRERIDGEDISAEQSLAPDAKRRAKNWLLNPAGSCARLFAPVKRRVRCFEYTHTNFGEMFLWKMVKFYFIKQKMG